MSAQIKHRLPPSTTPPVIFPSQPVQGPIPVPKLPTRRPIIHPPPRPLSPDMAKTRVWDGAKTQMYQPARISDGQVDQSGMISTGGIDPDDLATTRAWSNNDTGGVRETRVMDAPGGNATAFMALINHGSPADYFSKQAIARASDLISIREQNLDTSFVHSADRFFNQLIQYPPFLGNSVAQDAKAKWNDIDQGAKASITFLEKHGTPGEMRDQAIGRMHEWIKFAGCAHLLCNQVSEDQLNNPARDLLNRVKADTFQALGKRARQTDNQGFVKLCDQATEHFQNFIANIPIDLNKKKNPQPSESKTKPAHPKPSILRRIFNTVFAREPQQKEKDDLVDTQRRQSQVAQPPPFQHPPQVMIRVSSAVRAVDPDLTPYRAKSSGR